MVRLTTIVATLAPFTLLASSTAAPVDTIGWPHICNIDPEYCAKLHSPIHAGPDRLPSTNRTQVEDNIRGWLAGGPACLTSSLPSITEMARYADSIAPSGHTKRANIFNWMIGKGLKGFCKTMGIWTTHEDCECADISNADWESHCPQQ